MSLDWDKLRIFHAAAEAGSFTHAAEKLHLSQSAISRQVSSLEHDVGVSLFNRHARGLILTEQGELLFRTAHDVLLKLESVRARLTESKDSPTGKLRVTTTVGLGQGWLADRAPEFIDQHPDMQLQFIFDNEELDLNLRHADCAIRLRQPQQPDLIQKRLFTVHFHAYAAPSYIARFGKPESVQDLDSHRLVTFGEPTPMYLTNINLLETIGRAEGDPRSPALQINSLLSVKKAAQRGVGVALLPDYMVDKESGLVQIVLDMEMPSFDTYFCYPEAMKNAAKLNAFRDFVFAKARSWNF
ncbi:MAG: LysR family transcriptional regulator [Rhizobiaceae bacterium]